MNYSERGWHFVSSWKQTNDKLFVNFEDNNSRMQSISHVSEVKKGCKKFYKIIL